ncbi:hypothetical protein ElyMa_006658000 [Elysia marginata]|uniref:Uncharacterized protein n=1 Tax=Elysia marginata TaxID=1093978 RepID=A0AAV4IER4_9GAST|nr:hypothetical protein ElyMa_006658000 [Elysia marginata]
MFDSSSKNGVMSQMINAMILAVRSQTFQYKCERMWVCVCVDGERPPVTPHTMKEHKQPLQIRLAGTAEPVLISFSYLSLHLQSCVPNSNPALQTEQMVG